MNLVAVFREHARTHLDTPALIEPRNGGTRVTTFGELERQGRHAAALLLRAGLRPGDPVLVLLPMGAELYVALLALFRLGMVAVVLDPAAGVEHVERSCGLLPPRGLIAEAKAHLLRLVSPAVRRIPVRFSTGGPVPAATRWSSRRELAPHPEVAEVAADAPALLTFTSGNTGEPKGAVRSHAFLLAQHAALARCLDLTPGDVDLATLPIVLLANLASRVTSLIPDADLRRPGAIDPAPVVRQIVRHRATTAIGSPAFFDRLALHCLARSITLPGLRKVFTGGGPVFPRTLDRIRRMAPNADAVGLYGSTEAEPIARLSAREMTADDRAAVFGGRGLLAGTPVPEVAVRIVRDGPLTPLGFDAACLPAGEPGEIVVAGPHVLGGYLHGRGDHETKVRAGGRTWHRTGDAGYLDERGRLWLLGRVAGRIDDACGRLYPFAVEAAASADERVGRAAVVAAGGRRVLALEWQDAARPGDAASLRCRLPWVQVDEVRVCDRLPVDDRHNAKIDYPALAARVRDG